MPTGATDLGFDVVANQPQTELNYRVFVDTSGSEASLASINAIQQAGGGGRLAFSTDAADGPLAQRMLIDNQGNVGIGTDEPNARLDVVGDAKFNGPLNVQGALTASGLEVSGVAKIGGDLSATGKLTAASFAGDGAGLSNVTPADSSITSAKLAVDSASLSKVTGGKMVISADNVGIGTANPGAKLDVAGGAKFNGPLNVQGDLMVSGAAKIGGDLSVTGKLTAASFKGNGAGLSNVTPTDGSITNAKLAQDAASLSKVSGGKMVVQGDSVAIGGRLEVNGAVKFQGSGSTTPGSTNWQPYPGNTGVYLDVDTSAGKFTTTPKYFTSLGGNSSHWATTGVTSIYTPSPTGFRVYVRWSDGSALTPAQANSLQWHVSWLGVEA